MIEIKLPQVGMGMTDGTILRWHKLEGERVSEGEVLLEVEAAKTIFEVKAPSTGVLLRILVPENESVVVQTVIALMNDEIATSALETSIGMAPAPSNADPAVHATQGRVQIEPMARRLAGELGVSLVEVMGTGPHGRVTERDVRAAAALRSTSISDRLQYEEIPHSDMRRIISQRVTQAKQQAPHFYLTAHCVVDNLLELRAKITSDQPDTTVTLNDFVVKAVAQALQHVPAANVSWSESSIRRYRQVDVAVAVAIKDGLVTPVVRNADKKSLHELSVEVTQLKKRARARELQPSEFIGGSVTVSNLGMFGVEAFTAILNSPQSGIFAIGAIVERPIARGGQVAVGKLMTCTLSVDHRAIDGAVAAELLGAFKNGIENPSKLI